MRWSQTQSRYYALLADTVRRRLQLHSTHYGPGVSSRQDRAWITWDGQEIASFATAPWLQCLRLLTERGASHEAALMELEEAGIFPRHALHTALELYPLLPIDRLLGADEPLLRALAMLDRRLGTRRLRRIEPNALQHPLVVQLYQLRVAAERARYDTTAD